MKQIYKIGFLAAFAFGMTLSLSAQRVVVVTGWDPAVGGTADDFNNVLYDAIQADSTNRKTDPNVIFELKRNQIYPQGGVIKNYDYHLHIRGEQGEGLLPMLTPGKKSDGTYGANYINSYNDVTLEYLAISAYTPDGSYLNRMVTTYGKKSRYIVKGCTFDGDRGAGIVIRADSMKVYIEDVVVGNTGHRKTVGGNGRIIDFRNECLYVDTLILKNSTVNNASDRIIRNMNTVVNYMEVDHLTAINNVGYHGAVQLGKIRTAIVTNCLFGNTISAGHVESRTNEQTQPEKHFSVITLDSIWDGQHIEIRNNNIYFDDAIKNVWAKYDSVSAPWPVTPTIETAVGAANKDDIFFIEPLVFAKNCGPISEYIDAYYVDPTAAELPENWCVGGEGGYFLDEADLSYSTTSVSYTAADDGYPVGNLNYFPDLKARWLQGLPAVGIKGKVADNSDLNIYPNPVTDGKLTIEVLKVGNSLVTVYDVTGKTVMQQNITETTTNLNVSHLNKGIYIVKVDSGDQYSSKRFVIE